MQKLIKRSNFHYLKNDMQHLTFCYSGEDEETIDIPEGQAAESSSGSSSSRSDISLGPVSTTVSQPLPTTDAPSGGMPLDQDHVYSLGVVALAGVSAGSAALTAGPGAPVSVPTATFVGATTAATTTCTGSNCHFDGSKKEGQ